MEESQWFFSKRPCRGIALVTHGLNVRPSKMNVLVSLLNETGFDVYRLTLSGHGSPLEDFKHVTWEKWFIDYSAAVGKINERASQLGVPKLLVGFSLGALMGVNYATIKKEKVFDKILLFSPALGMYGIHGIVKYLPLPGSVCIPSQSEEEYKAHPCTPLAAYRALFHGVSLLDRPSDEINVPGLIFMDPSDVLVNPTLIQDFIRMQNLKMWNIRFVSTDQGVLKKTFHHLTIDEKALGQEQWQEVSHEILNFLGN